MGSTKRPKAAGDESKQGLLAKFRSNKGESEVVETEKKVSLFQLFRYTSGWDKLMLLIGVLVACFTGLGMPLMTIIIGDTTQNFIDVTKVANFSTIPDFFKQAFSDYVIENCFKYVYLGIAVFISATVQALCFLTVCENMVNRLRRVFFKSVLRQDIPWFDKNTMGTMTSKLFDNLERVKEGTGDKLGLMIQSVAQFFGGFFIAFFYDWKLTLIMMSLSPFMIISGAFLSRLMATASKEESKKYAVAGGIAEEVLTSMRTVIAFNGQTYECERYENALKDGKATGVKKSIYVGLGLAATFAIMFSSYALAFWVGTNFVADGRMTGGTVLTVFFSVMMGSMALGQAGSQFAVVGTAIGAAGSLYEVIDRDPEIDAYSQEGLKPKNLEGKVELTNVQFSYPTRPDVTVLQDMSLTANPGETVALVGASGCGKSTIIQLLLRYYNPSSGKMTIDGIAIEDLNIDFLRNFIGVVSQEPNLFNTSIEQNIRYGREDITETEIFEALKKANAYDFVKSFPHGLKTLVGDRGTQMSGGQKQRIAIARALVRDPKILLLDEATSALDAESESVVQHALENASKGRTTIVIAHRLSTVRNADKIIAIREGKVVEVGTHSDLIALKGYYHELVNAQVFTDVTDPASPRDKSSSGPKSPTSTSERSDLIRMKSLTSAHRLKNELVVEGAKRVGIFGILKYARPEWGFIALAVTAAIIQGSVFPLFSLLFSQIIEVFSEKNVEKLRADGHFWALMFLVLGGLQSVMMMTQCSFFGVASENLTMRLRSKVYRNVLRMDATYFDSPRHSPGKISTRLASDAPNVKSALDYRLGSVFNCFVSVVLGVIIAFYFGWQMAIFTVSTFPLLGVGHAIQLKFLSGKAAGDNADLENSGKIALEAVENIRTVHSLTLQPRLCEQFESHLDKPHQNNQKKAVLQGLSYGFASSVFYFLYAAAFRFGLYLILEDIMMPIHVLRVLFAISFTVGGLGYASGYFPEYIKATYAAGLIFKMLKEEPRIDGMTDKGKKPLITGSVKLQDVYFKYPERADVPILQGLSIEVNPGETLALVGSSGCGKSTVISLLERLYDPLDGHVNLDGEDIREMNPTHLRSHIALVSQEPTLFDTSIRSNIVYGLEPGSYTEAQILDAAMKANIHKFVSELPEGYDTRVGEKGTQLSGGQKQRIAIARALIRNPRILLLDEATSALDTESEKLVQAALDAASQGRTCIVVAHRLSTVVNSNCIVVVHNGKVVEERSSDKSDEKEVEEEKLPKASLFGLLRYASATDRILLFVGFCCAIVTGLGLPMMSVMMGNVSQNFIDSANATMSNTTDCATKRQELSAFSSAVEGNCLKYTYWGSAIFVSSCVQAFCFANVCKHLTNRLRRNFFNSILRQNIGWFDSKHSGTLATSLFDNVERVQDGTGDKLGLLIQFLSQFVGGFAIGFYYNWYLTLIMMAFAPLMAICGVFIARLKRSLKKLSKCDATEGFRFKKQQLESFVDDQPL
ncbi:unnamed protein product [Caenorhabditis auriculariae]|uniref:Uncharacterized protein n=1 Tax=Caenorhabditis auriculariae TaxID=2777116 RepID=A0A8S1HQP1_9PELO|nr:unnamed protein product [Caenorhabditis auriculariae]